MSSYFERTPNRTLLLTATLDFGNGPVEDCIVLQVEDRFNQIITPDPKATDEMQERIDGRLKHYSTKRKLDDPYNHSTYTTREAHVRSACPHGVPASICTICPSFQGDSYA